MAIKKMSSQDLNEMMKRTQETLKNMDKSIEELREDMQTKMRILSNNAEYTGMITEGVMDHMLHFSEEGSTLSGLQNRVIFGNNADLSGSYDKYGSTIHPALVKSPVNILNAFTGNSWIYRPTAEVKINGEVKSRFQHMLMHDEAMGKGFFMEEFDSSHVKLEIIVDRGLIMGPMDFNVIEISPFLPGSFSISKLSVNGFESEDESPRLLSAPRESSLEEDGFVAKDIFKVGASRIVLDKKYQLFKIEMDIHIMFQNEKGKFPFGLKHLYFLNTDFKSESYVVVKRECSGFVNTVGEDIFIHDLFGRRATTASEEGVKFFLEMGANGPEYEFQTSTYPGEWPLVRNTRTFYVKVPLRTALQGIEIKDILLR